MADGGERGRPYASRGPSTGPNKQFTNNDAPAFRFDALVNSRKTAKTKSKGDKGGDGEEGRSSENRRGGGYQSRAEDDMTEDVSDDGDSNDYYGDEEVVAVSLASVPADQLREMELDGFSLDDIQMSLYGEYGLKVSVQAIKRRMMDDKSERKGKVRTGKTRREKNKARQSRLHPVDDKVRLPAQASISIVSLAELIDVGGGEVVKYLMLNKGIMSSMNQNIDMALARELVTAFGRTLAEDGGDEPEPEPETKAVIKARIIPGGIPRSPVVTIMGHVSLL